MLDTVSFGYMIRETQRGTRGKLFDPVAEYQSVRRAQVALLVVLILNGLAAAACLAVLVALFLKGR